jgi:hypothetical protein
MRTNLSAEDVREAEKSSRSPLFECYNGGFGKKPVSTENWKSAKRKRVTGDAVSQKSGWSRLAPTAFLGGSCPAFFIEH